MADTVFVQDVVDEAFFGAVFGHDRARAGVFTTREEVGIVRYEGAKLAGVEGWVDVGGVGKIKGVC